MTTDLTPRFFSHRIAPMSRGRRDICRCIRPSRGARLAALLVFFLVNAPLVLKAEEGVSIPVTPEAVDAEKEEAQKEAGAFLKQLAAKPVSKIASIILLYDVHMDLRGYVKARMRVTLEMRRVGPGYTSGFSLTEPVGKDLWSRFALFVYGRHTAEYKEMVKGIETRFEETFRLETGRFMTEIFREVLPEEKAYKNQTGMKVRFDYGEGLVKFWEDQRKKDFSRTLVYTNQAGPLTTFFNFLLFEKPETELHIINAMKEVEDLSSREETLSTKKKVTFVFSTEVVRLEPNKTGRHQQYPFAVYFQTENYLDIVYGKNIFYRLAHDRVRNVKVPYSVLLDGIISKTKMREKARKLRELRERPLSRELYEEELKVIQEIDELAARDVEVYLEGAQVKYQ